MVFFAVEISFQIVFSILLNMFHVPMAVVPSNIFVFLFPVGLSLLIQHFQQVLWMGKETTNVGCDDDGKIGKIMN